jgi:HPt (histidine-containing phosphotransfer) domain-containing protein
MYDFGPALARVEGDTRILTEQMEFFLRDAPGLLDEIRAAVRSRRGDALQLAAHRLKGLVSNFDAHRAVASAHKLEMLGRHEKLEDAGAAVEQLARHVGDLQRAVGAYVDAH